MKNKIVKQLLGISVATILFAQMPVLSLAAEYDIEDGSIIVSAKGSGQYVQQGESNPVLDSETIVIYDSTPETPSSNTVEINATWDQTAEVTIRDLDIDVSNTGDPDSYDSEFFPNGYGETAIKITGQGNAEIELDGTNTLKSGYLCAGLQKENYGTLTIKDENPSQNDIPDSLTASGSFYAAGIGGSYGKGGDYIVIEGGIVTATGGTGGAGIGGGYYKDGNDIVIEGGSVTATGGSQAAGIGGGFSGSGRVEISGGTVIATGGYGGAGIGGGVAGAGSVDISGGSVTATGGSHGAGIGGGFDPFNSNDNSLTVSNDAIVKAAAGGIGSVNYGIGAAVGNGGFSNVDGDFKDPIVLESFTGSVIYYEAGTSVQSMIDHPRLNIDPNHNYIGELPPETETEGSAIIQVGVPKQNNDNSNISDTLDNSNDSDETPPYQGITSDMLTRQISSLMRTSKTGTVTIDFGRNICLTPELMKTLFETGNVAKNCTFTYMGKRYNMYIPVIDTKSEKYKDAMEELKKEDNNSGFAGFMRTRDIFEALGVTVQEIK